MQHCKDEIQVKYGEGRREEAGRGGGEARGGQAPSGWEGRRGGEGS